MTLRRRKEIYCWRMSMRRRRWLVQSDPPQWILFVSLLFIESHSWLLEDSSLLFSFLIVHCVLIRTNKKDYTLIYMFHCEDSILVEVLHHTHSTHFLLYFTVKLFKKFVLLRLCLCTSFLSPLLDTCKHFDHFVSFFYFLFFLIFIWWIADEKHRSGVEGGMWAGGRRGRRWQHQWRAVLKSPHALKHVHSSSLVYTHNFFPLHVLVSADLTTRRLFTGL